MLVNGTWRSGSGPFSLLSQTLFGMFSYANAQQYLAPLYYLIFPLHLHGALHVAPARCHLPSGLRGLR